MAHLSHGFSLFVAGASGQKPLRAGLTLNYWLAPWL